MVFFSNGFILPSVFKSLIHLECFLGYDRREGPSWNYFCLFFLLAIPFISTSFMKKKKNNLCAWRCCLYYILNLSMQLCLFLDFVLSCINLFTCHHHHRVLITEALEWFYTWWGWPLLHISFFIYGFPVNFCLFLQMGL